MAPKVLVTGGAGFVGSHICERLLLDGYQIVIVDVFNTETSTLSEKRRNIEHLEKLARANNCARPSIYKLDILREQKLSQVVEVERPTSCIHAASLVMDRRSLDQPMMYIINNVQGTQSLLNAIRRTGMVQRLAFVSTRSAVGEVPAGGDMSENDPLRPINPYGATKVGAEALLHTFSKTFGLDVSICRMQPIYGPRGRRDMMPRRLLESVIYGKPVEKYGGGESIRDWLYVEDAARGVIAAMNNAGGFSIFNFGTGVCTSLDQLIQLTSDISGGTPNLVQKSRPAGDAVFTGICDSRKAQEILNWHPIIDLRKGLSIMYQQMSIRAAASAATKLSSSSELPVQPRFQFKGKQHA